MFDLFKSQPSVHTRWSSFENPNGEKGKAATTNRGAKGRAYQMIAPGQTHTLLDVKGSGLIMRIWVTISDRSPKALRSLRLDMTWDDAATPAVSAPLGDFFGFGLAKLARLDTDLFSSPESSSFNCYVPMPFRSRATVSVTYESGDAPMMFFYDVDYLQTPQHPSDVLYFHTHWRRENPTVLAKDFTILPSVRGEGRFVGCNMGVNTDPRYESSWWGEGEFKAWLDGDGQQSTLCGTGTEDYIGSGWGQKEFNTRWQGCTVANKETRQWAFFRHHIPDPVLFHTDFRAVMQQIGGSKRKDVIRLRDQNKAPLIPITREDDQRRFTDLLLETDPPKSIDDESLPDTWCNFYRSDDVSSTAYFYLDKPENGLPALAAVNERTAGC